jgi:hypothetical protein
MIRSRLATLIVLLGAAACGSSRTTAATQPNSPVAFEPAKSDAKAIEIADKIVAAAGGAAAWDKVKEIQWTATIYDSGTPKAVLKHAWDRWNGRHFMEIPGKEGSDSTQAMYELYSDTAAAIVINEDGRKQRATADNTKQIVDKARQRFYLDSYPLVMHFKLKDPGVTLKFVEERRADGATEADPMKFDVIKASFDAGVAGSRGDVYYIVVDKQTSIIDHVEIVETGKTDEQRLGYRWSDWVEVGGLKFATTRQNLGFAAEKLTFTDVKVSDSPDEDLYVPTITEASE